jgi:hypothetical protein
MEYGVEDYRNIRNPSSQDRREDASDFPRRDETNLTGRGGGTILQQQLKLIPDDSRVHRVDMPQAGSVLHSQRGRNWERVTSMCETGFDVGLQTRATRVNSSDHQDTRTPKVHQATE